MTSEDPITIHSLPTELLAEIFGYFAAPAPDDRLHEQPRSDMLRDPQSGCPLKNISLVSRRWRAIALRLLFRHAVWTLDHADQLLLETGHGTDPIDHIPILAFLRAKGLGHNVRSFTMIIDSATASSNGTPNAGSGTPSRDLGLPNNFLLRRNLTIVHNKDNNWVWEMLFSLVDPLRFTIIASPQSLAKLLSCAVFVGDADFYSDGERLHILSVSRDPHSKMTDPQLPSRGVPSQPHQVQCARTALFTVRPWTHLLLNENSSIRVYRHYHFFDHHPPSILPSLLGCEDEPNDVPLIPPSVTALSYVAIFPSERHFRKLELALPRIDRLFMQLIPRNDILLDPDEMSHVEARDLWGTSTNCYNAILRRLLSGGAFGDVFENDNVDDTMDINAQHQNASNTPGYNWRFLKEFRSGDAASEDSWAQAAQYIELSETGWRVEEGGVFVKGPAPEPNEENLESEEDMNDGGDSDSYEEEMDSLLVDPMELTPFHHHPDFLAYIAELGY
ncbi:hypothetical protein VTI74DRAFT_11131 [Chaetomium olivicolor]